MFNKLARAYALRKTPSYSGDLTGAEPVTANARATNPKPSTTPSPSHRVGPCGVDLNTLAFLPQDIRGRTIEALYALEEAERSGNKAAVDTAAATMAGIIAEIQDIRAQQQTKALFTSGLAKAHGARGIMEALRKRVAI